MRRESAAGAAEEAVDGWTQVHVQPEVGSDLFKGINWGARWGTFFVSNDS